MALAMSDCRLIYRSRSIEDVISNVTLRELIDICQHNNEQAGITGLLVLSDECFLQVLEGPLAAVNRLFGNISRDKRHRDVELLSFEQIGPRFFDQWTMRLVDFDDLPMSHRKFLASKYATHDAGVVIPMRLHLVYSLLLDAKALCLSSPWADTAEQSTDSQPV